MGGGMEDQATFRHTTVLLDEAVDGVLARPDGVYVDGTFGRGGHSRLLLSKLSPAGRLIAIDRDPTVEPYFERFRRSTAAKTRLLSGEFSTVLEQLAENGVKADAILMDLGVSSMQLDRPDRGFSYAVDAPLDHISDTPFGRVEVSHVCLNDDVVEGLRALDARAFSVQYHPEAAAGPHDAANLFDQFVNLMAGEHR